jgi:hypothetical protein
MASGACTDPVRGGKFQSLGQLAAFDDDPPTAPCAEGSTSGL